MASAEQIKAALAGLDPKDDAQWTTSGQPIVDNIKKLLSDESVTRQDITNADPTFTRDTLRAAQGGAPAQVAKDPVEHTGEQPSIEELLLKRAEADAEVSEALEYATLELKEAQDAADEAARKVAKVRALQDRLLEAKAKVALPPHVENTLAIQAFQKSQLAQRTERAGAVMELRKAGITADMFQKGSALDRAMTRNRNRGTARPAVQFHGVR